MLIEIHFTNRFLRGSLFTMKYEKNEKYSASKILFLHQKLLGQNHYGKRIFDAEYFSFFCIKNSFSVMILA
jgi:hypothetical protein